MLILLLPNLSMVWTGDAAPEPGAWGEVTAPTLTWDEVEQTNDGSWGEVA